MFLAAAIHMREKWWNATSCPIYAALVAFPCIGLEPLQWGICRKLFALSPPPRGHQFFMVLCHEPHRYTFGVGMSAFVLPRPPPGGVLV